MEVKEENLPILTSSCPSDKLTTREDIKNVIKSVCADFLYDKTQRTPIIIPVILVKKD